MYAVNRDYFRGNFTDVTKAAILCHIVHLFIHALFLVLSSFNCFGLISFSLNKNELSKHRPQKCPWSSSKKRKKRRKTETITMNEGAKSGLAASDKGSYYQQCFSSSSDSDEDEPVGSSRQKIEYKEQKGAVEIRAEFEDWESDDESESCDEFDDDESSDSLTIIDGQLLQDALKESAICRDCKTGELQLLKDETTRNGQGQIWILQCKCMDCKSHNNPKRFHTSPKRSRFYDVNRAIVLAFRSIGCGYSAAQKFCSIVNLPNPVGKKPWSRHT